MNSLLQPAMDGSRVGNPHCSYGLSTQSPIVDWEGMKMSKDGQTMMCSVRQSTWAKQHQSDWEGVRMCAKISRPWCGHWHIRPYDKITNTSETGKGGRMSNDVKSMMWTVWAHQHQRDCEGEYEQRCQDHVVDTDTIYLSSPKPVRLGMKREYDQRCQDHDVDTDSLPELTNTNQTRKEGRRIWARMSIPWRLHWHSVAELTNASETGKEGEYEQRYQDHDVDTDSLPELTNTSQTGKEGTSIGTNYSLWMWVTVVCLGLTEGPLAVASGFFPSAYTGFWEPVFVGWIPCYT